MSVMTENVPTAPVENPSIVEPQEPPSDSTKSDEVPLSPSSIVTLNRSVATASRDQTMLQALTAQLEYYFSSENLSKDGFLRSKMSQHNGYAPVELVAGFNHVIKILLRMGGRRQMIDLRKENSLQLRCELLIQAASMSEGLDVLPLEMDPDGNVLSWGVGPKLQETADVKQEAEASSVSEPLMTQEKIKERNTIIFREVPTGVTKEDISQLIQSACTGLQSNIDSIREDVGHCWFVHFNESFEDKSLIADCILQMRQMDLKGQTIKARLKTEKMHSNGGGISTSATFDEHRGVKTNGSRYRNYNPSNGRRFRKPFKRHGHQIDAITGGVDAKLKFNGPPPEVNDSHFPVLGNNPAPSEPRDDSEPEKEATDSALPLSIETNTQPKKSEVPKTTDGTVPSPGEPKKEAQGAYAAALLKPSAVQLVEPVKKNVAPVIPKKKVAPLKATPSGSVRGDSEAKAGKQMDKQNNRSHGGAKKYSKDNFRNSVGNDEGDSDLSSACSVDNGKITETTASSSVSISSTGSSSSPAVAAAVAAWGGWKKSFADIVKTQDGN